MYGRNVTLTFHGHDKFRTNFGAFCTIFIALIVISYAVFKATELTNPIHTVPAMSVVHYQSFYEQVYDKSMTVKARDNSEQPLGDPSDPVKVDQFFAFGLGYEKPLDPRLGRFSV